MVWHLDVGSSHPGAGEGPGLGCSPIKVARELGSERRDSSVPSVVGAGNLRGSDTSTGAPPASSERISAESILSTKPSSRLDFIRGRWRLRR